jgi:hypothetical protein
MATSQSTCSSGNAASGSRTCRGCFDADGNVKSFAQWPPEARSALAGFEIIKKNAGDGKIDTIYKFKRASNSSSIFAGSRHSVTPPGGIMSSTAICPLATG